MRTSNSILIGLIIVVFTIPFLIAFTLKGKIKKGQYTVEKYNNSEPGSFRSGSFAQYKVVKVEAPRSGLLTCRIKVSNTMDYKYFKNSSKDSVQIITSNDTLYVKYIAAESTNGESNNREYDDFKVDVNLPVINNLVVDGAFVIIESEQGSSTNISVTLKNNGQIRDAVKSKDDKSAKATEVNKVQRQGVQQAPATSDFARSSNSVMNNKIVELVKAEPFELGVKEMLLYDLLRRI